MAMGFWVSLPKPFFILAPMANVTDAAFRRIIVAHGKPDVVWTEFVSVDGLCSRGRERLLTDLWYTEEERPVVAQIFGGNPALFTEVAELLYSLKFDGIDINMGCPDRGVEKQGAGANLIKDPKRAHEIIAAAKKGAHGLPVSVKTRIGYTSDTLDTWLPYLLEAEPAAVTLHARTRKEMSLVPAQWDAVARAVAIRDRLGSKSLIIGNGDALDLDHAKKLAEETGCDGVMLGRAIFGNPWLFSGRKKEDIPADEKIQVLLKHVQLFDKLFHDRKNFAIMKKHFKSYVGGFEGSHHLRAQLMETTNVSEVLPILEKYLE